MNNINDCLLELEKELTKENYQQLLTLISDQHKWYRFNTPHAKMILLLSKITQEEGLTIGEYCREYEYEDVVELLQRARNY